MAPREFTDAKAAGNCSARNGAIRGGAELKTAAARMAPREFTDAKAAGNCSARNGAIRGGAELKIGGVNMKILVINGPNINFLGIREKSVYGTQDYAFLESMIAQKGQQDGHDITVFQSNYEGAIIDRIQQAYFDGTEGIVINPGAYTHYSYAIRDALASITAPKAEIHISDITQREEFRKVSVTAPVCQKQIYGKGLAGYLEAIDFVANYGGELS